MDREIVVGFQYQAVTWGSPVKNRYSWRFLEACRGCPRQGCKGSPLICFMIADALLSATLQNRIPTSEIEFYLDLQGTEPA